jgi:hypothetical protein
MAKSETETILRVVALRATSPCASRVEKVASFSSSPYPYVTTVSLVVTGDETIKGTGVTGASLPIVTTATSYGSESEDASNWGFTLTLVAEYEKYDD